MLTLWTQEVEPNNLASAIQLQFTVYSQDSGGYIRPNVHFQPACNHRSDQNEFTQPSREGHIEVHETVTMDRYGLELKEPNGKTTSLTKLDNGINNMLPKQIKSGLLSSRNKAYVCRTPPSSAV